MNNRHLFSFCIAALAGVGLMLCALPSAASPANPALQKGGGHGGGGGGSRGGGGGGSRGGGGGGVAHPNREVVRTNNYVPHPGQIPTEPRRQDLPKVSPARGALHPAAPNPRGIAGQRTFTKTPEGRKYDNGLVLRKGIVVSKAWQKKYFRRGHYHFPHYRGHWIPGQCYISPFGFYFGICAPFISTDDCVLYPPAFEFVDQPVYNGDNWAGYADANDPNYLNDQNLDQDEPGLSNALGELNETFANGDISGLVTLIDPSMRIAIYERGTYQYSMNANDFVDLTRDAIQSAQTVSFTITYLHQRAPAVFAVDAQHVYKDTNGNPRSVYVSYALQDISGQWTLTQIDTAPDVNQAPQ